MNQLTEQDQELLRFEYDGRVVTKIRWYQPQTGSRRLQYLIRTPTFMMKQPEKACNITHSSEWKWIDAETVVEYTMEFVVPSV